MTEDLSVSETATTSESAALGVVRAITIYPIKSLSAQQVQKVALAPDACLPADRQFAIAHGATGFDFAHPAWVKKSNFAVIAKHDRLAALDSHYDPATGVLQLSRREKVVASGNLKDEAGRAVIEQFLNAFLDERVPKPVRIVSTGSQPLTDQADPLISVINLATLKDLERVMGQPIDPRRFRGNILVDTGKAWSERGWVGQRIRLGDNAEAEVIENIERCAAINMNPDTRERDMNLPAKLVRTFSHMDCGVFIRIVKSGELQPGSVILSLDNTVNFK